MPDIVTMTGTDNNGHSEYTTEDGKTRLQSTLTDKKISAFRKYQDINLGSNSVWALIKFEFYTLFIAPLPGAVGYVLRKWMLKHLLGVCGSGVIVGRNVTIRHPAKLHLGDRVIVDDYAVLDAKGETNKGIFIGNDVMIGRNTVLSCKDGDIHIGYNTNLAMSCFVQSAKIVRIGNKVLFGAYCYVIGGGDHISSRIDVPIMDQGQTISGIEIGNHCWFGADVKVMDGVRIGRDAILGTGAVVVKDVPKYTVAAGIPARVIRDRRIKGDSEA